MMKKYKRVFCPNPNQRFDSDALRKIGNEIIYVCDRPMFDNLMGPEYVADYEHKIMDRMYNFDPDEDVVAYYGDSMIYALMVMWLSDNFVSFDIARFSAKENGYLIRTMSFENFAMYSDKEALIA